VVDGVASVTYLIWPYQDEVTADGLGHGERHLAGVRAAGFVEDVLRAERDTGVLEDGGDGGEERRGGHDEDVAPAQRGAAVGARGGGDQGGEGLQSFQTSGERVVSEL